MDPTDSPGAVPRPVDGDLALPTSPPESDNPPIPMTGR
ncbi:hypothetical protein FHX37_2123 [Haloactinospora alba]|uniref:Uncharacterized protein n=1 Tax=Haloactinospora alba TaxID=405555 RepID=A0A543NJZ1_9ACTN|nr:hypothetical protein FHX37_2123 [Haloactinospora alba]